ncbi:MAG: putative Ig domain-containing protein, partial [Steroidobacteraceae bacterium]|nr:putative Ig domain-containing protein [Deltaproteobacteria bacterium]
MREAGRVWAVIAKLLVVLSLLVSTSEAAEYVLNNRTLNRNTLAVVDDATASTGLYSFKVDGKELMWQQWFWYRVGSTGGEASLESLGVPVVTSTATSVSLTYTKPGEFSISVLYQLTPYAVGQYRADLKKTVKITNISTQPLDFHLFEYSDYEITQLATQDDNVEVVGTRVYQTGPQTFSDEGITLVHESSLPPTSFDIDNNQIYLLPYLKDADTLNVEIPQTTYSYGDDMQFAYQWDLAISVAGTVSFDITDKVYPNLPLTASKVHTGTTVDYQGSADYTISFNNTLNNWPYNTALNNIRIIDSLPDNTLFTAASTGGVHDPATNIVTWSLGNLAAAAPSQSVQASVTVNSLKDITNEAILVSDEAFPTRVTDLAVLSNHPPSITSSAVTAAYTETLYSYQVKGSDVDAGTTLTYTLAAGPVGMKINSSTGVVTWTPTIAQTGSHQVNIQVSDGSLSAAQSYTVNVIKVNRPPVITSVAPTSGVVGQPYTYAVAASDPDGDATTLNLEQSAFTPVPQGMTMTGNVINWIPLASQVGTYNISISATDSKLSYTVQNFPITVVAAGSKQTPTITWPTPAAITYGTALSATQLNATASVPGSFVYTPASGTLLNAGTQALAVVFTPTDTTNYNNATATVSMTVSKAAATVTLGTLGQTYSGTAKSATVTTNPAGLSTTFTYGGSATAPTAAGTYAVVATVNDADFSGSATGTLTIAKATPTVTWSAPTAIILGSALSGTQLNATASTAGSFVYSPASGTVMNTAGANSLSTTFTPTDTANYTNATATVSITVNGKQNPVLTWATPAAITYGTALSATQLNATVGGGVAGTFSYSPASGTVLNAGSQTLTATFTPTNTTTYNTATATVTLTVNKAAASVALSGLTATYDGSAKAATATTTPAGKTVAITYAGSTTAPTAAGTYAVV